MLLPVCLCLTLFCACCDNHPHGDPGSQDILILKFKDSVYKDFILTNDQGEYFASTPYENDVPYGCWETMQGRNPYISLMDGYVLVDWRWEIHWNNQVVVFIPWQEQTSWTQHWDTTVAHVHNPILAEYHCAIQDYDQEMGNQYGRSLRYYPYITNFFTSERSHSSSADLAHETSTQDLTKGMTLEDVEAYYDAVYAEIAEQLDSAIARGQFPLDCMDGYVYQ